MASIMVHSHDASKMNVSVKSSEGTRTAFLSISVNGVIGDEITLFFHDGIDTFLDDIDTAIRAFLDNRK